MGSGIQNKYGRAVDEVLAIVKAAATKFPTWPDDPLHAMAIVGEEFGEAMMSCLQCVYEPHKSNPVELRLEVQQTAAMCLRFLRSLETGRYKFRKGPQHDV